MLGDGKREREVYKRSEEMAQEVQKGKGKQNKRKRGKEMEKRWSKEGCGRTGGKGCNVWLMRGGREV